jgi:hypothetical protein
VQVLLEVRHPQPLLHRPGRRRRRPGQGRVDAGRVVADPLQPLPLRVATGRVRRAATGRVRVAMGRVRRAGPKLKSSSWWRWWCLWLQG